MARAHRAAYALFRTPPGTKYVLHACNNPRCVNPEHLYLGTQQNNMDDREAAGHTAQHKGEDNGRAKLTEAQVRAIRRDTRWPRLVARELGVSVGSVKKVRYGATWKHVR